MAGNGPPPFLGIGMSTMERENSVSILVSVKPKALRDEVTAWEEGVMRIRVKALPRKGEANEGCRRLLAHVMGIAVSKVSILKGRSSPIKKVRIWGLSKYDVEQIRQRWLLEHTDMIGHKAYEHSRG